MSGISAEDVAQTLAYHGSGTMCERMQSLVRALQAVRVAAEDKNWHTERCPALYEERPQGCTCGADALTEALAAVAIIEKGESNG